MFDSIPDLYILDAKSTHIPLPIVTAKNVSWRAKLPQLVNNYMPSTFSLMGPHSWCLVSLCFVIFLGKLMFLKPIPVGILWCLDWNVFLWDCFPFATARHLRTLPAQDHTKIKYLDVGFLNHQDSVNFVQQICTRASW